MMIDSWFEFIVLSLLVIAFGIIMWNDQNDILFFKIAAVATIVAGIGLALVGVAYSQMEYDKDESYTLTERKEPETDINFELGALTATRGVADKMEDPDFAAYVLRCLGRYISCDWGEVSKADFQRNDLALKEGDRIFAVYEDKEHQDWRIYIITEWDRSATTVLFPDEY